MGIPAFFAMDDLPPPPSPLVRQATIAEYNYMKPDLTGEIDSLLVEDDADLLFQSYSSHFFKDEMYSRERSFENDFIDQMELLVQVETNPTKLESKNRLLEKARFNNLAKSKRSGPYLEEDSRKRKLEDGE